MANEVTVIETQALPGNIPVRVAPFLAVQTLSIGGAVSSAFNKSTTFVSIHTSTACSIEFSNLDGTDPDGAGAGSGKIPIPAGVYHDFRVHAGSKVIAVA